MAHPGWLWLLQGSLLLLARARQSGGSAGACPARGKVSAGGSAIRGAASHHTGCRGQQRGAAAALREFRGWRGGRGAAMSFLRRAVVRAWGARGCGSDRCAARAGCPPRRGCLAGAGQGSGAETVVLRSCAPAGTTTSGCWRRRKTLAWAPAVRFSCAMREELRCSQQDRAAWSGLLPASLVGCSLSYHWTPSLEEQVQNSKWPCPSSGNTVTTCVMFCNLCYSFVLCSSSNLISRTVVTRAAWSDLTPVGGKGSWRAGLQVTDGVLAGAKLASRRSFPLKIRQWEKADLTEFSEKEVPKII